MNVIHILENSTEGKVVPKWAYCQRPGDHEVRNRDFLSCVVNTTKLKDDHIYQGNAGAGGY